MPQYRYMCTSCGRESVELVLRADQAAPEHCDAAMAKIMPRRVVGRCRPDSNGAHAGSGFARPTPAEHTPAPSSAGLEPARTVETPDGETFELLGDPQAPEYLPEQRIVAPPHDPSDPTAIPEPAPSGLFAKDYEDCNAAERDSRWRDTSEALTAWHARQLDAQGAEPAAARATANATAQHTVARARSESTREDGLS